MNFINNIGYVVVCVMGGVMVTRRAIEIGDVQALFNIPDNFPSQLPRWLTLPT
ncbi:hypothetical protein N752_08340 [Desulforamulus aquiferis]|nr:hypothetical protein N752_08340 [Desulforamulus aquiferis]